MDDLSLSIPFSESDLLSFFYEDGEHGRPVAPPMDSLPDPSVYGSLPQPVDCAMDFALSSDQIPPLFPLLDQLKLEPIDDIDIEDTTSSSGVGSPLEIEPLDELEGKLEDVKPKKKKGTKKQKDTPKKRTPAARKNSKRPTKKQKVEVKTSFIASLKGLSSAELEKLAETRPLSPKEQSDLKKYIRMIKNRESAQLSRERRKIYQETLERALAAEGSRNSSLKQQIIELEAENKVLQREFLEFKNLIENSNLGKAFSLFAENNTCELMNKAAAAGDSHFRATMAMYLLLAVHAFGNQFALSGMETNPPVGLVGGPVEARA